MDPMLPKYLIASISTYFEPIVENLGLKFFVEGVDNPTKDIFQSDSVVLRINGPVLYEGSAATDDEWYLVEIQLLITDIMRRSESGYNAYEWAGTLQSALQTPIPINNYADPDNPVLIECLKPDMSVRNNIRTANYQVIDKDLPINQMSVHGRFLLCP